MIVETNEFNYKALVIGIILLILFGLFLWSVIPQKITPKTPIKNITPNVSTITIYETVFVTPTPDGINYFASEFENGTRKMLRFFTIQDYNATGYQTLKISSTVYDYKVFNSIHWFNYDDYRYYQLSPSNPDNEFLFVFYYAYMDNVGGSDVRFYLPFNNMFSLLAGNNFYYPNNDLPKYNRIQELENTYNYNDDSRVKPFGYIIEYTSDKDYAYQSGMKVIEDNYLMGGKSNAKDGWLMFEIPKNTDLKAVMFESQYGNMGESNWLLIK